MIEATMLNANNLDEELLDLILDLLDLAAEFTGLVGGDGAVYSRY